ncbi:MAG: cytochrome ubiquinol oxidase subunit I, partial [Desulfobulbaceae bacterium]|nr:cytochrome ubiquinol oxidase subunit I [Desulfobulbaceae bacterium]
MNYPVWQLDAAGGGLLIAAIAVFHVYISHFAIGGGLFLVLTEIKAYREESPAILDYVHRHTKFFLLTTMVLGGMTGVGIWFTISLLTPAATSTLIHNFVFGWAIEWLFFVGEIVALFIYYNTFGTMNRRDHLRVGWLYFLFAWLSLFVINGIIGFMLTPGAWLTTGNFWDGFFNPTFWPALALRTTLCLMLAGLYGFVTASFLEDRELRERMVRYCALWLLAPFYFFLASAWWYSEALPGPLFDLIFRRAPELAPYLKTFFTVSPVLFAGGLLIAIRMPSMIKRTLAVAMLLLGITYMGSFEFIREGGRRPFIIRDHTYSTAITVADLPRVQAAGFLQTARWIKNRQVTAANRIAAGREVFNNLCLPCHSISGPMKDILPRTAKHTPMSLDAKLRGMGRADTYMPPFAGNDQDRRALIAFILEGLHHQAPAGEAEETTLAAAPEEQPLPFDPAKDEYVLLAWADSGMGEASDVDHLFGLLPAANRINAQLLRRGETPELLRDSVALSYKGGEGLAGRTGTLAATGRDSVFSADLANLSPYSTGNYQPYPVVTVEARDQKSGRLLAAVKTVVPVATELGCKNCHGGGWRLDNRTGIAEATGLAILAAHDRSSRTDLQARARGGKPASCRECHADPRFNAQGRTGVLNLSAAIHGFHAPFLEGFEGAAACHLCHATNPAGASRAFRGIHHEVGLDCVNCHGAMADHAVSLLRAEAEAGKKEAARLITHLAPQTSTSAAAIKPRQPWVNEPDCLACHEEFGPPAADNGFNRWNSNRRDLYRQRLDDSGSIRCAAC